MGIDSPEVRRADSEVGSEKARTSASLAILRNSWSEIKNQLPPVYLFPVGRGLEVQLPEFLRQTAQAGSFKELGEIIGIPESTACQIAKTVLEFLRLEGILPIPSLSLDLRWRNRIEGLKVEAENIQAYEQLQTDLRFQEERSFLNRGIVISKQTTKKMGLIDFLEARYGWGSCPRQSLSQLGQKLGRSAKRITSLAEGGMAFLNEIYGAEFRIGHLGYSVDVERFYEDFLVMYSRLIMAKRYLEEHRRELLPVERLVLQEYLAGQTYEQIIDKLKGIQVQDKEFPDEKLKRLRVTPKSAGHFLGVVFGLQTGRPFFLVWRAEQARKVLKTSREDLNPTELKILSGLVQGESLASIVEKGGFNKKKAQEIVHRLIGKQNDGFQDRERIFGERKELHRLIEQLGFSWKGKERDLAVLKVLSRGGDVTYKDAAEELSLSEEQVSTSVARARAMLRRGKRDLGQEIGRGRLSRK